MCCQRGPGQERRELIWRRSFLNKVNESKMETKIKMFPRKMQDDVREDVV